MKSISLPILLLKKQISTPPTKTEFEEFEKALEVQKTFVKKLKHGSDKKIVEEFEEIGNLLNKMGKKGVKAFVNGEAEAETEEAAVTGDVYKN